MTLNMGKPDTSTGLEYVYPGSPERSVLLILPYGTIECAGETTAEGEITAV